MDYLEKAHKLRRLLDLSEASKYHCKWHISYDVMVQMMIYNDITLNSLGDWFLFGIKVHIDPTVYDTLELVIMD